MTSETDLSTVFSEADDDVRSLTSDLKKIEAWARDVAPKRHDERELDTDVEKAFLGTVPGFLQQLRADDLDPESVGEIGQELQSTFRQPLVDAIQRLVGDIVEEAGIDVEDDRLKTVEERLEAIEDEDDLRSYRDSYSSIYEDLANASERVKVEFAGVTGESPDDLAEPESTLRPRLNDLVSRHEALSAIEESMSGHEWAPETAQTLSDQPRLYDQLDMSIPVDDVTDEISKIDSITIRFENYGIRVSTLVMNALLESIEENGFPKFGKIFGSVTDELERLAEFETAVENTYTLTTVDTDTYTGNTENIESVYSRLKQQDYHNFTTLRGDLKTLDDEYSRWRNSLSKEWSRRTNLVEAYRNQFDFERPAALDRVDAFEEDFDESLERTLAALTEVRQWIYQKESHLDEQFSEEGIQLLHNIVQGGVDPSDYSIDAIDDLREDLPLKLNIDENG
jgi:hypothetical protein